jgi:putative flippase GtrA
MTVLWSRRPPDAVADAHDPTLSAVLTRFARTTVPSRLYQLLQFGIPFALDLGLHGHLRAAASGIAIAALGAWGLADRWLFTMPAGQGRKTMLIRYARVVSGTVAGGLAAILLVELFLRLLGNAPIS